MGLLDRFRKGSKQPDVKPRGSWGAVPGGSQVQQQAPAVEGEATPAASPPLPGGGVQFLQGQQVVQFLQGLGLGDLAAGAGNVSVNISTDDSVADLQKAQQAGMIAPGSQVQYTFSTDGGKGDKIQEIIDQADYDVLASGETAESTILEVTDLGIRVAGNNPAVKMLIEVQPRGREPFRAEVVGFVNEASVHKLQVGNKLTVKYDPADTTRVTVYHTGPEGGPQGPGVIE